MKRNAAALIDESRCIGCKRCIDVCPVDAIVGAQGMMHTVVESWCIGCNLCPPACPVDCIDMLAPRGEWTEALKRAAGARARRRRARIQGVVFHQPQDRKKLLAEILARKRK